MQRNQEILTANLSNEKTSARTVNENTVRLNVDDMLCTLTLKSFINILLDFAHTHMKESLRNSNFLF